MKVGSIEKKREEGGIGEIKMRKKQGDTKRERDLEIWRQRTMVEMKRK